MLERNTLEFGTLETRNDAAWGPALIDGGTRFRLWAPDEDQVKLSLSGDHPMKPSADGWFEIFLDHQPVGAPYGFILSDGTTVPDPASRQQQTDVSGLSILTHPDAYPWKHPDWRGRPWTDALIYEIHIGAFTPEGTFRAAADKLVHLAELGITAVELMPIAHFPGDRGWGYDGVMHYAPHNMYGTPDDLKAFIDTAHGLGLMVFLDVVYNHFGPEGNFLSTYASSFFHDDRHNPWGTEIAFDRLPVRRYFLDNALYWLNDFRLDGLRFDAINEIKDNSRPHILKELSTLVRNSIIDRHIHLITENPPNGTDILAQGLFEADWNDDFHHAAHCITTGETQGVYEDFGDDPIDKLGRILSEGYFKQGQPTVSDDLPPSASLAPTAFVHFLQNHDQIGNRAMGDRLHTTIDEQTYRTMTAILLLSPQIPLLFMGDCYKEKNPFQFFCDYTGKVADAIREDRPQQAENFGGYPEGLSASDLPDPSAPSTFLHSKLDWSQAKTAKSKEWSSWLKRVIHVRMTDIVPHLADAKGYSGTVVKAPTDCVFIDWTLGSVVLQLRLNLSTDEIPFGTEFGDCIWPDIEERTSHRLAPMSASVFRRDA